MRIEFIYEPCDLWAGIYYNKKKKWIYILPLPTVGIVIKLKANIKVEAQENHKLHIAYADHVSDELTGTMIRINDSTSVFHADKEFNSIPLPANADAVISPYQISQKIYTCSKCGGNMGFSIIYDDLYCPNCGKRIMWIDTRKEMPLINKMVLCITRKFGHIQNRIDTDTYELLWWNGKVWENMDIDDFENNPDYFAVVYWMYIPDLCVEK